MDFRQKIDENCYLEIACPTFVYLHLNQSPFKVHQISHSLVCSISRVKFSSFSSIFHSCVLFQEVDIIIVCYDVFNLIS